MPIYLPPLNRRRFLAGTLAAGIGAVLPRFAQADEKEPKADPNRFLLLSDTHIGSRENSERHNIQTVKTFSQTVEAVLAVERQPAQAIVSGDCAFLNGEEDSYRMLGKLIRPLRKSGMAMHFAMGNHDNRDRFFKIFPEAKPQAAVDPKTIGKFVSVLETPKANWFLLDSLEKTNGSPGRLGEEQLTWLAKELDSRPDKPALLVAHHNPDRLSGLQGLADTSGLFNLMMPRKHVKAYFYGHTHQWHQNRQAGLHLITIPTTAWLFDKIQPRGFVLADLKSKGATLELCSLDPQHPKHGEKIELAWRS